MLIPIDMLNIMFTNAVCKYCHEHSLRASAVKNEGLVAKIQVMCANCDKRMEFWAGKRMKLEENASYRGHLKHVVQHLNEVSLVI